MLSLCYYVPPLPASAMFAVVYCHLLDITQHPFRQSVWMWCAMRWWRFATQNGTISLYIYLLLAVQSFKCRRPRREHRIVCNCRKIFFPSTMFSSEYSSSRYILQHIVAPEDGCGISMCKYVYDSFSLSSISSWLLLRVCVSNFSIHLIWMGSGWRGSSPISVFQIVLLLLPSITVICHVLFSFQNTARRWSRRQPPFKTEQHEERTKQIRKLNGQWNPFVGIAAAFKCTIALN